MRRVQCLVLVLILSACGRDRPETGTRGSASSSAPYTADSESRARDDGPEDTHSGSELEAPRLIPALRNQLDLMSRGSEVNRENLTAYKNMASDLVTSMQADLSRVGFADSGQFKALSDSVLNDIGAGTPGPEPSQVKEHVTRMRRLLELYQQTMKGAANKL